MPLSLSAPQSRLFSCVLPNRLRLTLRRKHARMMISSVKYAYMTHLPPRAEEPSVCIKDAFSQNSIPI